MIQYLGQCLKKGSLEEIVLACRVLTIVGLTQDSAAFEVFTSFAPLLKVRNERPYCVCISITFYTLGVRQSLGALKEMIRCA